MSLVPLTPEEHFAAIVEAFRSKPDVTLPAESPQAKRGFGSSELKVRNKIFAMLSSGNLVVKLPKARVDALVVAGEGERFDPRHDGRLMKEWVMIAPAAAEDWLPLAQEAMEFVTSKT